MVNSKATANWILKMQEYAKQLADSREKNAEQAKIKCLTEMLAGISQQSAPPP